MYKLTDISTTRNCKSPEYEAEEVVEHLISGSRHLSVQIELTRGFLEKEKNMKSLKFVEFENVCH